MGCGSSSPSILTSDETHLITLCGGDGEDLTEHIKRNLSRGTNVNCVWTTPSGTQTPLMVACNSGKYFVAKLLLESKADMGAKNNKGQTALDIALSDETAVGADADSMALDLCKDDIAQLLQTKPLPGHPTPEEVQKHSQSLIDCLLKDEPDPQTTMDSVRSLVIAGADVNCKIKKGADEFTPLLCAVGKKQLLAIAYLRKNNANVLIRAALNPLPKTPYELACSSTDCKATRDIKEYLAKYEKKSLDCLKIRAASEIQSNSQKKLLQPSFLIKLNQDLLKAAENAYLSDVMMLLAQGASIDCAESESWSTSLMYATQSCALPIVQCLIELKANPELANKDGKTALDIGQGYLRRGQGKYIDICKFLEAHHAAKP